MTAPEPTCGSEHCVTCGDDGVPMMVVEVDEASGLARCEDLDGGQSTVEVALVAPVARGSLLLVHAGTAIASLGAPLAIGAGASHGGAR